ncbi:MAG TPA: hypothetical protein VIM41_04270 [Gammaproteobacteria bacterium]
MKFINLQHNSAVYIQQTRSVWWFIASLLVFGAGSILAARQYPGGFDWPYTVASALASQKHNPAGSAWFAGALSLSMVLLWPYVSTLKKSLYPVLTASVKFAAGALRFGILCGALVGAERLFIRDLSNWVHKAHELLAVFAFLGLYFGALGLLLQVIGRHRRYAISAFIVASALLIIGVVQLWVYLAQRDLGWVDTSWRAMGIPVWLSFAFWQWLAIGWLWAGLGLLSFADGKPARTSHFPR